MESLQRHLRSRLANTLGGKSTNGGARFRNSSIVFVASLLFK